MDAEGVSIWMNIWDSLLSSHAFMKTARYKELVHAFETTLIAWPNIAHTDISDATDILNTVFAAPCVEVIPLTVKKDELGSYIETIDKTRELVEAAPGNIVVYQNYQIENP
jgi:hypothetical protein